MKRLKTVLITLSGVFVSVVLILAIGIPIIGMPIASFTLRKYALDFKKHMTDKKAENNTSEEKNIENIIIFSFFKYLPSFLGIFVNKFSNIVQSFLNYFFT